MLRVYADGNDQDDDGAFLLIFDQSRRDLYAHGTPQDGQAAVIYSDEVGGEWEIDVCLQWRGHYWVGIPISDVRYPPDWK